MRSGTTKTAARRTDERQNSLHEVGHRVDVRAIAHQARENDPVGVDVAVVGDEVVDVDAVR
jgi:hypothetical protein